MATSSTTASTTTQTSAAPRPKEFAAGAYVEGTGQWLRAPTEPTTKRMTGGCTSLADAGWTANCERVRSNLGEAVWIQEHKGEQERVLIYVNRDAERWDLALRASDDDGKAFNASVVTADLTDDGNKKILVKLQSADDDISDGGLNPPTQVDVVEPTGMIVVHLVLGAGRSGKPDAAALPRQGLEVLDCPMNCVPTGPLRVRLIAYRDGGWRVVDEGCRGPTC